jgi:hypothetical protein
MAWSAPMTAVANSAFTAAQFNQYVRDNLNESAAAKATTDGRIFVSTGVNAIAERVISSAYTAALQNTASTSFTDLTTVGPTVSSVTTGTRALVYVSAELTNNTTGGRTLMGVDVSGATTVAASDDQALMYQAYGSNAVHRGTALIPLTGLTAGSNTFKAVYKVNTGTGGWQYRRISVIAL